MTGSPVDIFNQEYKIGHISGVDGKCSVEGASAFDVANAQLSLVYPYDAYMADSLCTSIADPVVLGYNEKYDLDSFSLELDINSLITALAVCKLY
jgi:hypothetical protein